MPFPRRTVALSRGSSLDVLEFGDRGGVPALYLHGTPSSGSEAHWIHAAALRHGVRLISLDRPGYLASPAADSPGFDVVARRCVDLAEVLGLEQFGVLGFSGGAGYALAVASEAGDAARVVQVGGGMGSIVGAPPGEAPRSLRVMGAVARRAPRIAAPLVGRRGKQVQGELNKRLELPMLATLELLQGSSAGAQLAAAEAHVRSTPSDELRSFVEGYVEGSHATHAVLADLWAITQAWPFALGSIKTPVELWHGTKDGAVPLAAAQRTADALPNATLHILEGEGHFVFLSHGNEVCAAISSALQ
jgi:pimeloyl-ACP methyl ester carboxylesterase